VAAAAHFGLGQIASARGDLDAAIGHFQEALQAQPRATSIHTPLGLALRRKGRTEEARAQLAQAGLTAVSFDDPEVESLNELVTGARAHIYRGDRATDLAVAQREYELAVQEDPSSALAHHSLGTMMGQRGDVAGAIAHLQRATELDPRFPEAFFNLATALLRQGRREEALRALDRVLELDPAHDQARLRRAATRREGGETELARADLEAVLQRQPLQADAIVDLAVLLAQSGDARAAERLLREKLAKRPPPAVQARLFFTQAFLDNNAGRLPAAIEDYRQAVAADRNYADAWFNLGVSLVMARRQGEAATAFAEVVRLVPDNARAHLGLARALMARGDWRQARSVLEAARQRLPGDAAIAHDLAELLASSPDPAVRDGQRALDLAMSAYAATKGAEHAEVVGMALAELGRFPEAVDLQRKLAAQAEAARAPADMRARLKANLGQYQRGQRVRMDGNLRVP
jgi:tetratricopeptide (TPR) repeat protein